MTVTETGVDAETVALLEVIVKVRDVADAAVPVPVYVPLSEPVPVPPKVPR